MKEKILSKIKNINIKYLHITIIVIGIIFIAIPVFHSNIWFDEAYSVAMANHSFSEIWKIGGNDVHPILYYFILHVINIVFGNNIMAYRFFSMLCIALLSVIGYTHIRKDFGDKTGLIFSFLALFLPVSALYSEEIRMYSLGMLLGTIMAIYAYRIYKNKGNKTTFIFFGLSSLAVAYTHYYGLMLAGIVNLLILVYLIKNYKTRGSDLKKFIITAVIQVIAYLPWLVCFLSQLKGVSKGFWITLTFPGTLYEVLTMQFKGNLQITPVILTTVFYSYITYLVLQQRKQDRKPATWGFAIYIAIILIALLVSLCMHSAILLYRYLLIITGLLIFGIAYFMAKDKNILRVLGICVAIIILSICSMVSLVKENYNKNNTECIDYIKQNVQTNDIIIYSNAINGAVVSTELSESNGNISYFYNKDHWGVQEAYKAFAPFMKINDNLSDILDNYQGRIWIVESSNTNELANEIKEKYATQTIEEKQFREAYKNYNYTIELIEK